MSIYVVKRKLLVQPLEKGNKADEIVNLHRLTLPLVTDYSLFSNYVRYHTDDCKASNHNDLY